MDIKETYSTVEVATLLKVKNATIRRWVKQRKLRAIKIGRRLYITKQSVADLLSTATATATQANEL
jgi:excisionase family DNA binding protein